MNEPQPILVSTTTAKRLLDIGNSKFWDLVKAGKIELTDSIGRRMVIYRSLERLAPQQGINRATAA